jgi:hypothetical protein
LGRTAIQREGQRMGVKVTKTVNVALQSEKGESEWKTNRNTATLEWEYRMVAFDQGKDTVVYKGKQLCTMSPGLPCI